MMLIEEREDRFEHLSAVAKAITESHCNGYLFFRNTVNHTKETA
jgi:hypothetical protein